VKIFIQKKIFTFALIFLGLLPALAVSTPLGRKIKYDHDLYRRLTISARDEMAKVHAEALLTINPSDLRLVEDVFRDMIDGYTDYHTRRGETQFIRPFHWQISIQDTPAVNASCMTGGKIFINIGFLDFISRDKELLAAVIGHEISHAICYHSVESVMKVYEKFVFRDTLVEMLLDRLGFGSPYKALVEYFYDKMIDIMISFPHSRRQEFEADRLGMNYLAAAGFEPDSAIRLEKLLSSSNTANPLSHLMSTHPAGPQRVKRLEFWFPSAKKIYNDSIAAGVRKKP
jgi:hypothetical protein